MPRYTLMFWLVGLSQLWEEKMHHRQNTKEKREERETRASPEIFTGRQMTGISSLPCVKGERETVRWLIGLEEEGGREGRQGRERRDSTVQRIQHNRKRNTKRKLWKGDRVLPSPLSIPFPLSLSFPLFFLLFSVGLLPDAESSLFSKFPLSFLPFFLFRAVLLLVFLPITGSFIVQEREREREGNSGRQDRKFVV